MFGSIRHGFTVKIGTKNSVSDKSNIPHNLTHHGSGLGPGGTCLGSGTGKGARGGVTVGPYRPFLAAFSAICAAACAAASIPPGRPTPATTRPLPLALTVDHPPGVTCTIQSPDAEQQMTFVCVPGFQTCT